MCERRGSSIPATTSLTLWSAAARLPVGMVACALVRQIMPHNWCRSADGQVGCMLVSSRRGKRATLRGTLASTTLTATIESANGPLHQEAGETPARPRHCKKARCDERVIVTPQQSAHHATGAPFRQAGKASGTASSQETGPVRARVFYPSRGGCGVNARRGPILIGMPPRELRPRWLCT